MSDTQRVDLSPEELEDLRILQKTQQIREMAINIMTKNGTDIPSGKGQLEFLTQTLNGLDDQVIKRKRLKIEDKKADNESAIADLIEQALSQMPTMTPTTKTINTIDIPVEKLLERPLVPGETDISISGLDYDSFDKDISRDL